MNDAQRVISLYNFEKIDRLPRREFYIWEEAIERWKSEGWDGDASVFGFDPEVWVRPPMDLGGTEAPIVPHFKEEIVKITDRYEYVRMRTGEVRMFPIGKRHGVMPVFERAIVECAEEWFEKIKPRLDPGTPERWNNFDTEMSKAKSLVDNGSCLMDSYIIGGYMFLRNLLGPEKVMYAMYDDPDLIHDMMKTWLNLEVTCLSKVQKILYITRLSLDDDIAYNKGPLISPRMFEEFLVPYYKELIETLRNGQKEFMHAEINTDGNPDEVLPIYIKNGFTAWCPCEVAAGCDPVEMGKKYPELVITGGIDKRILADGKDAIKRELDRIIPFMKERGGYIPTCDHGVPDNVSFENYLFYRKYLMSIDAY